jgi:LPXTG-motif cell wall-anchored protein
MLWLGVIVVIAGMFLRFGLGSDTAHWSGLAALAVGAVLVIGGLLLARRRRRTRRSRSGIGVPLDYKTSKGKIAAMIIAVVYILSPIDFIPEIILGPLGIVDDMGALSWLAVAIGQEYTRRHQSRQALGR